MGAHNAGSADYKIKPTLAVFLFLLTVKTGRRAVGRRRILRTHRVLPLSANINCPYSHKDKGKKCHCCICAKSASRADRYQPVNRHCIDSCPKQTDISVFRGFLKAKIRASNRKHVHEKNIGLIGRSHGKAKQI